MKFYHNRGVFVLGQTHTTPKVWNASLSPRSPVSTSEVPSFDWLSRSTTFHEEIPGGGVSSGSQGYVDFLP